MKATAIFLIAPLLFGLAACSERTPACDVKSPLSDEEAIRAASAWYSDYRRSLEPSNPHNDQVYTVVRQTADEVLRNEDCCVVYRDEEGRVFRLLLDVEHLSISTKDDGSNVVHRKRMFTSQIAFDKCERVSGKW